MGCCRDSGKYTFSVACFMLELYQDDLADLLLPPQPKVPTGRQAGSFGTQLRVPKLEIKKDAKGMVSVPGATMIEARLWSPLFTMPLYSCVGHILTCRRCTITCSHAGGQGLHELPCLDMLCGMQGLSKRVSLQATGQPAES